MRSEYAREGWEKEVMEAKKLFVLKLGASEEGKRSESIVSSCSGGVILVLWRLARS